MITSSPSSSSKVLPQEEVHAMLSGSVNDLTDLTEGKTDTG